MRFFILSDLHLSKPFDGSTANNILKRLCREIRKDVELGATILFIFLGDIASKGAVVSFEYAKECLDFIYLELKEYDVKLEFVPGNHDLADKCLTSFDEIVRIYGNGHSFEDKSTYSSEYAGINFIFTDSNILRDHSAQGKLDIESINKEVKSDRKNVLFCHHALSHSHGDTHDTIEDSAAVITKLNEIGIDFFFHGHVHQADVTIPEKGMVEIGSGCLSGDLSYTNANIQHQFTVGYIRDNNIICVQRWVDNTDGNEIFASNQLFPERKTFVDPSTIDKETYERVDAYISRTVLPYETATGDTITRYFSKEKALPLNEVLQKHSKILLLCDAGMGKSIELLNLAHTLCDKYHTFLYSLKDYVDQDIINLLPEVYRKLPSNRIALLLDGYDELSNTSKEIFEKKFRNYLKENENSHIVITSRSNFCRSETTNESKTFPTFNIYVLSELDKVSVVNVLKQKDIDEGKFFSEANAKKVNELVTNPFYLTKLSDLYINANALPKKSELMDKLIEDSFELDEDKYPGDLGEQYCDLFRSLEIIAFSMQLMKKYILEDRSEYQELFGGDIRSLVKQSGLFKREKTGWSFSHNNFREYLAAKQLAKLSKDEAISIFACGTNIKPSWVNTLGYLTTLDLPWNLQEWLVQKCPTAIVKFESDRVDKDQRFETFKQIFTEYENKRLHFNDELCDTLELACFANSNKTLSFLLERIENPRHFTSQYTALNILRHFPSLYGKNNTVRNILINCCKLYPKTDKVICRLAIIALFQLKLNNQNVTSQLFDIFGDSQEDYVRLGMYEYLINTNELDSYSKYFLDGIKHIQYKLNDDDVRIGNESFELVNGLKSMSTIESVSNVLLWFSEKHADFHDSDKVLFNAIDSAIKLYKQGYTEIYDVISDCYISAARHYNNQVEQASVKFFKETNTQYAATVFAIERFKDKLHHIYYLLRCDATIMDHLKEAYKRDEITHSVFRELVVWYVKDEKIYNEYAQLIKEIDGVDIVAYKAPIDYESLKDQASQEYFDSLFDQGKREYLFKELLSSIDDENATTNQILDVGRDIDYNSSVGRLKSAVFQYGKNNCKICDFFDNIDINDFIIWSASKYLEKKPLVKPATEQKRCLANLLSERIDEDSFKDPAIYYENGFYVKHRLSNYLSLIIYLDLPISKDTALQFTELPRELFSEKTNIDKYTYLQSKLSFAELKNRMIANVQTGKVKDMILKEHIDYFDKTRDESIAEYALKICKNDDSYLRFYAWQYLYHLFGEEYIESEILPFADADFLIEINCHCKNINKEQMRFFMEKQYKILPTLQLQAHLITLGSEVAVVDYVDYVAKNKKLPEGKGIHTDGATCSIGSICNSDFLPLLKTLLLAIFDKDFKDGDWHSLRSSLSSALINCSKSDFDATVELILECRPDADSDERNFSYCNFIISDIQGVKNSQQDIPLNLTEVKQILTSLGV